MGRTRLFFHADEINLQGKWKHIANEHDPFVINKPATLARFGAGGMYQNKLFDPGTYYAESIVFNGIDPAPGVAKIVEVWEAEPNINTSVTNNSNSTVNNSSVYEPDSLSPEKWYSKTWVKIFGGLALLVILGIVIKKMI